MADETNIQPETFPTAGELMGLLDSINDRFAKQNAAITALAIATGSLAAIVLILYLRTRADE